MKKDVVTLFPAILVEQVETLRLTKTIKGKAYYFIKLLLNKCLQEQGDYRVFYEIPAKYLEKVFTKNYHNQFLNKLICSNIIQTDGKYVVGDSFNESKSKGYRVNRDLLKGDFTKVTYKQNDKNLHAAEVYLEFTPNYTYSTHSGCTPIIHSSPISLHLCTQLLEKSVIFEDLMSLQYDEAKLMAVIDKKLSEITEDSLVINEAVQNNSFEWYNHIKSEKYYTTKENAFKEAEFYGVALIQDADKYYLDDIGEYIKRKMYGLRFSYLSSLSSVIDRNFYANRNTCNNRLDHNLTSISKDLLVAIKQDNDLVEIDIVNSQFAIHAHWLEQTNLVKEKDVEEYCVLCKSGMLYEELRKTLCISREKVKSLMFSTVFSKPGNSSDDKEQLIKKFPTVINHIDEFKKSSRGYQHFAITLQKIEASMMIDNVYWMIKNEGIFCLPKHDSLIVRNTDRKHVLDVMRSYFKAINFGYALAIT